jgi:predicted nucleotidyltransferase
MLEPQMLAQHKETILKIAAENEIQEVKVFGKHIGQEFDLQSGINFIIIPNKKMTSLHKRNFEQTVAGLLKTPAEVFTPTDLKDLAKDAIITHEQVKSYLEGAVPLEDFVLGITRKSGETNAKTTALSEPVSVDNVLTYLEKDHDIWAAISSNPAMLSDAFAALAKKVLSVK